MRNASHTIREELGGIVAFMGVIWGVFIVSRFIPSLDDFGVVPRTLGGLAGFRPCHSCTQICITF